MPLRNHFVIFALAVVTLCSIPLFGQGAKVRSEYEPLADADRDEPSQREQWFMRGRMIPGRSAAALRYRAHLQKMQSRAARQAEMRQAGLDATSPLAAAGGWTPLGPAPLASDATGFGGQDYNWVSGRATALAVDPADSTGNTVYIGGAYGGVWKSTTAGPLSPNPASVTWIPLTDAQPTLAVGSIAIQPGNSEPTKSVILVGTGETNSSVDSYYGLGILRSADAGNTWTLISQDKTGTHSFAGLGFSRIAFSTANPNLVVAAAAGASQGIIEGLENPASVNRGVYYSADGGISWNYASVKDAGVTVAPGSVSAVIYNAAAGQFFAALRFHGIYSSSDGINWSRLANQPGGLSTFSCPANPSSQSCPIYRGEFAVVPGRNEMYVWYVDRNATNQGIWKTTDGGSTWTRLNDAGITNCGDAFSGCGTQQGIYNLELAAVPNGTATDLYAGAVNIYKCTISSSQPSCSGTGSNTFLNLTHAYGCPPDFGSIAHVHPDQHAATFMVVNGKAILYFANDGGIYRALDGYTGLTTGTCGGSNQLDSLNQTLGSMTQFVSFSQHPTDANTLLGGSQDNGSPATTSSQSSSSWANVNGGDGGYNAINPDNPTEWFTANTGVSIQKCSLGGNCRSQDFNNGLVASNATVGGDVGPFYTPYILDPQNSAELLVGTCRVWRGTTSGAGFTPLSNSFETGSSASCTGSEINLVRSLAAGGIKDSNGLSNVVYAGTDGFGPSSPTGGHLWVSANADGGPGSWLDHTGPINPGGFPVSGIAIDTSDKTGKTAYVTIMGFHVSHVWKTTDAGASWADFTANLPDAPASAVLVDPSAGTVYVASDVGVFSSSTSTANWTEVGPAPGSAEVLPNVAVTALRIFNSGGTKKLRASTYGRGIWEFTLVAAPDFQFAVSANSLTVFAGQTAIFTGTLTAQNGYSSAVSLSCINGATPKPPACSATPSSVTPANPGAPFTVNASGPAGDYLFDVHGAGTDANTLTRDFSLTLHVVDFNLTAPAPGSVTVNPSATSDPVSFQVTAAGAFNGTVILSCTGLPAGASCNFQPASSVNPTSAIPVSVTLTIATSNNTPAGTFAVTINASAPDGSNKTQSLSLVVATTQAPDFAISNTTGTQTINAGGTATYTLSLSPIGAGTFANAVTYSCSGLPALSTCSFNPPQVAAGSGATNVTMNIATTASSPAGTPPGTYTVNVNATSGSLSHSTTATLTVQPTVPDFSVINSSNPPTIRAGGSANYNLTVNPFPLGSSFNDTVSFTCSNLPPLSKCSFNPNAPVTPGTAGVNVTLTISTTAPSSAQAADNQRWLWYAMCLPLSGLVLAFSGSRRRSARGIPVVFSLVLVLALVGLQTACGGGGGNNGGAGQPGTPSGNYTITVTATSGSLIHTAQPPVTLTVR